MVFSQGAGSGFGYDYTRQYDYTIRTRYGEKPAVYILPEDSFVTSGGEFYINGGRCSRYWVNTESGSGSGNHYTSWSNSTYINFAFCKKGDIISYKIHTYYNDYSDFGITVIPARK